MKITEIRPHVYYIKFPTQYDACMGMIRMQEFYESQYLNIRGKSFTLEDYMDTYAQEKKHFDYDQVWDGFNIPSTNLKKFLKTCKPLRPKELQILKSFIPKLHKEKFYIIAGSDDRVITHELAHAYYYLKPEYKKEMNKLINNLPKTFRKQYEQQILKLGYHKSVLFDELQAYFVDSLKYKKDLLFKTTLCAYHKKLFQPFYNVFLKYE